MHKTITFKSYANIENSMYEIHLEFSINIIERSDIIINYDNVKLPMHLKLQQKNQTVEFTLNKLKEKIHVSLNYIRNKYFADNCGFDINTTAFEYNTNLFNDYKNNNNDAILYSLETAILYSFNIASPYYDIFNLIPAGYYSCLFHDKEKKMNKVVLSEQGFSHCWIDKWAHGIRGGVRLSVIYLHEMNFDVFFTPNNHIKDKNYIEELMKCSDYKEQLLIHSSRKGELRCLFNEPIIFGLQYAYKRYIEEHHQPKKGIFVCVRDITTNSGTRADAVAYTACIALFKALDFEPKEKVYFDKENKRFIFPGVKKPFSVNCWGDYIDTILDYPYLEEQNPFLFHTREQFLAIDIENYKDDKAILKYLKKVRRLIQRDIEMFYKIYSDLVPPAYSAES